MSFDVETMPEANDRRLPWAIPGATDISGADSITDALAMAKLDWEVEQVPVFQKMPGDRKFRPVPNRVFNTRSTDGEVLGIVTPKYHITQNREAFAFLQALVQTERVKLQHAGTLENGRLVFVAMKLLDAIKIPGDDSELTPYVVVTNAHDGYRTLTASVEVIRLICTNGMTIRDALSSWKIKHTAYLDSRLGVAQETLGLTAKYLTSVTEWATRLSAVKVTDEQAEKLIKGVFPVSDNATETQVERSQFYGAMQVLKYSETLDPKVRRTAWGILNAITEFVDHASKYRSKMMPPEESRAESLLFGQALWKKQQAWEVISRFAKVA
jgi:phage/plasmid-like protein (TIGR03299 family)